MYSAPPVITWSMLSAAKLDICNIVFMHDIKLPEASVLKHAIEFSYVGIILITCRLHIWLTVGVYSIIRRYLSTCTIHIHAVWAGELWYSNIKYIYIILGTQSFKFPLIALAFASTWTYIVYIPVEVWLEQKKTSFTLWVGYAPHHPHPPPTHRRV